MVEKPGQHRVSAPVTVSRVIARAVPLKFGAVLSECRVVRGWPEEPEVVMVDADALMNGDTSQDIVLNEGDVVFIPESFGSDVLDTLGRALGPISGTVTPGVQIYTATQIGR